MAQFGQHVETQTLRVAFAGPRKFHNFKDDKFGQGVFPVALEL
jgi:hypothetical protein